MYRSKFECIGVSNDERAWDKLEMPDPRILKYYANLLKIKNFKASRRTKNLLKDNRYGYSYYHYDDSILRAYIDKDVDNFLSSLVIKTPHREYIHLEIEIEMSGWRGSHTRLKLYYKHNDQCQCGICDRYKNE